MIGPIDSSSAAGAYTQQFSQRSGGGKLSGDLQGGANFQKSASGKKEAVSNPQELTEDEKRQVEELKQRDAEVRAHEQAHLAAAGSLAMGGPNYVFQTGPDGRPYAIGGNVKIDTSKGNTPEETLRKARQIRAAALAPSDPSPQDLKVASAASSMETEASQKISDGHSEKSEGGEKSDSSTKPTGEITSIRQLFPASDSSSGEQETGSTSSDSGEAISQSVTPNVGIAAASYARFSPAPTASSPAAVSS